MNWSHWVYLGTGLLLGISSRWLFAKWSNNLSSYPPVAPEEQQHLQLQQQAKQAQLAYQMARQMSQFKAGFLARTTHELRSPLNGLIGLHQLILSDLCESPAEEREFIAQAHERALKLLKLIDEILCVARVEHGTNKLDIQPQQLDEIFQEVHDLTYMLAVDRNFKFLVSPPEPEIRVLADRRWLRQVLVSLVDTAISQMKEGSICFSSNILPTINSAHIWLDVPARAIPCNEPIDLIKSDNKEIQTHQESINLSPGMKMLLNQTLLEMMGGKLEIMPLDQDKESTEPSVTRLQVSIPLGIPSI